MTAPGDRWLVDPVWPARDGALQPVDWAAVTRTDEARAIVDALRGCDLGGASALLRGGVLEQRRPHPRADIDLILVTDDPRGLRADLSPLRRFGRPIDALVLDANAPDPVLLALARTRSLHAAGPPFPQAPAPLDRALWLAHWMRYAAFLLPADLTSQGPRRVAEAKQVIRAVGLVCGMARGVFTRDLPICIAWARAESAPLADDAQGLLETMETGAPYDIRGLQAWLRTAFYARIAVW